MNKKILAITLALAMTIGISASAYAAYDNPYSSEPTTNAPAPGQNFDAFIDPDTGHLPSGDGQDNGIGNANASGKDIDQNTNSSLTDMDKNNVIKSKGMKMTDLTGGAGNQRTHGAYQNNTNSCASCHQTHTGASKDLLIKRGVYNTCTACHDGTLGFYNVFSASTAGTFAGTKDGNASVHLANGSLTVDMAPGFNDYTGTNTAKTDNFDCASCHAPHGSYSDRLLHYSPQGMADIAIAKKGNKIIDAGVVTPATIPSATATSAAYVLVRGTAADAGITGEPAATPVLYVVKRVKNADATYSYVRDANPWVAGYEHAMNDSYKFLKVINYCEFFDASGKVIPLVQEGTPVKNLDVIYGLAYAKGAKVGDIVKASIARAYVVKFNQIKIGDFGGIDITKIDINSYDEQGKGKPISEYCGACHTDYMTHSGSDVNGAFRHSTDSDRFNCLKCHFAHGTDVTIMKDARDRDLTTLVAAGATDADAKAYLLDKNPSSALKRYTNMSVCWKCHSAVEGKSSKLMNNTEYWTNFNSNPYGGVQGINGPEANWLKNTWEGASLGGK